MKKRIFLIAFLLWVNFLFFFQSTNCLAVLVTKPKISAKSAIAVELNSDQIVFQKEVNVRRPIASTTKVMTALVSLDELSIDQVLTTTPKAASVGEAEVYLEPDETMTVENLLYAMLLRSANDAAMVLSEGVGKTSRFIDLMNKKARALGALNTHFTNPHGLYNKKHYSTAYDLYLISKEALKNPVFSKIVATRTKILPRNNKLSVRKVINHNKLVLKYDYIKGVKTGYTIEAGYCLIALAELNSLKILTVVLDSPTSEDCYADTLKLVNYLVLNYSYQNFIRKGEIAAKLYFNDGDTPLLAQAEEDLSILYQKGEPVVNDISLKSDNYLPIKKGTPVGSFRVFNARTNKVLGEVRLIAKNDVNPVYKSYRENFFKRAIQFFFQVLNFFRKGR